MKYILKDGRIYKYYMKDKSIFSNSEVRHSIVRAIYCDDLDKFPSLKTYKDWLEPFLQNYEKIKDELLMDSKKNSRSKVFDFIRQSNESPQQFFKKLFNMIEDLESRNLINSSEEFIGDMLAWMLDPVRFIYVDNKNVDALKSVNSILDRQHKIIRYNETLGRYVFDNKLRNSPIDKDALYFYGDRFFISKGKLYFKKPNDIIEIIKAESADIKILKYLIGMGKGNINNWLKKKDFSGSLDLKIRTVSNSISDIGKISSVTGIDLIEGRGIDSKGREYRINPKVL